MSAFRAYTSPAITRHFRYSGNIHEPCASGLLDRGNRPGRTIGWDARWDSWPETHMDEKWWQDTNWKAKQQSFNKALLYFTVRMLQNYLFRGFMRTPLLGGAKELAQVGEESALKRCYWTPALMWALAKVHELGSTFERNPWLMWCKEFDSCFLTDDFEWLMS